MTDLLEPHVHRLLCLDTFLTQTVFTSERNPLSGWERVLASGNNLLHKQRITEVAFYQGENIDCHGQTENISRLSHAKIQHSLSPRAREAFLMEGVAKS